MQSVMSGRQISVLFSGALTPAANHYMLKLMKLNSFTESLTVAVVDGAVRWSDYLNEEAENVRYKSLHKETHRPWKGLFLIMFFTVLLLLLMLVIHNEITTLKQDK